MPEKYCALVHNIIFCVQNCQECLAEVELEVFLNEETKDPSVIYEEVDKCYKMT